MYAVTAGGYGRTQQSPGAVSGSGNQPAPETLFFYELQINVEMNIIYPSFTTLLRPTYNPVKCSSARRGFAGVLYAGSCSARLFPTSAREKKQKNWLQTSCKGNSRTAKRSSVNQFLILAVLFVH